LPLDALEDDGQLAKWLADGGEFVPIAGEELPDAALTDDEILLAWLDAGGELVPRIAHDLPDSALTNDEVLLAWLDAGGELVRPLSGRENVVEQITAFISRINTGTLTVTGTIALLFVGISLLRTIEAAFNDIWGVTQGRSFVKSVIYYWAVITLGPIVLVAAVALTTSSQTAKWQAYLDKVPFLPTIIAMVLPAVILTIGFAVFYALMPNTRVNWKAALVGGAVGGCLWQANNLLSVIYVGRVVSYTSIYGSLGAFPLFLVGLYFSWLIVLLGAQVAYAYQNRGAYIEERQAEMVNQRGRDFIALRLMTMISDRFLRGEKPATLHEISCGLAVPSALVSKLVATLVKTGLLLEVADQEIGYAPGRPVNHLTAHDVLRALRSGQGIELATKEDPWRTPVRSEFEKIVDAERQAGQTVTLEMLAQNRGEVARATT
jgi:membrane protein